jgi:tetratricopeptide (TPR) repeat protein
VPFDRDATLKKAEKLLRQGRLEPAIAEYERVVEESPRDWSTANTLGELYARAGKPDQAIDQYTRIAEHFVEQGFYPKAAALFKKILKLRPQDETTQIQLADISARQGLLADAKAHLNVVAARRRAKGDRRGAAEIIVRLGTIDPADFDARLQAARTLEDLGQEEEAGARFKALHADLLEKGRIPEAMDALKEFVRMNPLERDSRATLAKAALENADLEGAREFLDEDSAGDDPTLLLHLIEIEVRSNEVARARALMKRLLEVDPRQREAVLALGWKAEAQPDVRFACVDAVVDAAVAASEYREAAATLQDFTARVSGQIPALLKLVEICVDGGLEQEMYAAQEQLTDAYLAANQATEARVIAEDLVAREPWERAHIDRFRQALVMLRVSDPDTVIAERLSGQAPFMARDPFFDEPEPPPPAPAPDPAAGEAAEGEVAVEESNAVPEVVTNAVPDSGASAYGRQAVAPQPVTDDQPPAFQIELNSQVAPTPTPAPVETRQAPGADEVDLTDAFGDEETAAPPTSAAPPEASRDARAEQDYSTQHMTLARTYLEIGMLDEAITALQAAVRSPRQRFEAAAALGRVYDKRGDQQQAIEWLERAAEAPAPTADEGRALLYDLGVLLDGAGETSRALAVFLELQSDAGDYRDVPARIDRLARVQAGG